MPQTTSSAESPAAGPTGENAAARPASAMIAAPRQQRGGDDQRAGQESRKHRGSLELESALADLRQRMPRRPRRTPPIRRGRRGGVPARPLSSSSRPSSKRSPSPLPPEAASRISSETRISPPIACAAIRAARIDVLAEEVALLGDHLAGVEAHADPQGTSSSPPVALPLGEGPLDGDRALERLAGIGEGEHETIALALHLVAIVAGDLLAEDRVVLAQQLGASARRRGAR